MNRRTLLRFLGLAPAAAALVGGVSARAARSELRPRYRGLFLGKWVEPEPEDPAARYRRWKRHADQIQARGFAPTKVYATEHHQAPYIPERPYSIPQFVNEGEA